VAEIEALGGEAVAVAADLCERAGPGTGRRHRHRPLRRRPTSSSTTPPSPSATTGRRPLLEMPRADWLHHFAVNTARAVHPGPCWWCRAWRRAAAGGSINVTTGSAEAHRPGGGTAPGVQRQVLLRRRRGGNPGPGRQHEHPGPCGRRPTSPAKRALDRFSNVVAPQLVAKNVFIMGVMPGWVATESSEANTELGGAGGREDGLHGRPGPDSGPTSRACENPLEYTGRVFFAERELAALGLTTDD